MQFLYQKLLDKGYKLIILRLGPDYIKALQYAAPEGYDTSKGTVVCYLKTKKNKQKINDKTIDPNYVANFINELYNKGKYTAFDFQHNTKDYYDCYGETETHGPLWIRPDGLKKHNIFKDTKYYQVVGHTMDNKIKLLNDTENIFIVDVLAYTKESLIIDINEQGKIKFEINKK